MPNKIEITEEEYKKLKESADMLEALYQAGVDNWDGYGYALEIKEGWKENAG